MWSYDSYTYEFKIKISCCFVCILLTFCVSFNIQSTMQVMSAKNTKHQIRSKFLTYYWFSLKQQDIMLMPFRREDREDGWAGDLKDRNQNHHFHIGYLSTCGHWVWLGILVGKFLVYWNVTHTHTHTHTHHTTPHTHKERKKKRIMR